MRDLAREIWAGRSARRHSMSESPGSRPSIGTAGALSIGIGGIVGGGFFATFGLTIAGAKGGTPLAFLIGGAIALLTAYSYVGLTLRYPGPGGTTTFIRTAFGQGRSRRASTCFSC